MLRSLGLTLATALYTLLLALPVSAETHPCTGASLPLSTEGAVVQAAECLYGGRVVKVERAGSGSSWVYRLRILLEGGRVRSVDFDPASGQPVNPADRP